MFRKFEIIDTENNVKEILINLNHIVVIEKENENTWIRICIDARKTISIKSNIDYVHLSAALDGYRC